MAKEALESGKVWDLFLKVVDLYGGDSMSLEEKLNKYHG